MSRVLSDNSISQRYALPLEVEIGKWHKLFQHLMVVISAFVIFLIALAAISPVREIAIAEGQIVPKSSILRIQHYEGGIVDALFVQAGQIVEEGQKIAHLSPIAVSSDFSQLRSRRSHLILQQIRLRALLNSHEPDYSQYEKNYPIEAKEQLTLHSAEKRASESERQATKARISQREAEYTAAENELASLDAQIVIFVEQLGMREKLLKQGYTSRRSFLESKAQIEQAKARRAQVRGQIYSAESAIAEAKNQLSQVSAVKYGDWSKELADIVAQIAELDQTLAKHSDRVERLTLRAPVKGIIQDVGPKGSGEVVGPGELVASIVPIGGDVIAEVQVKPEDIGHIEEGYEADIRLTAFDAETYGKLRGKVISISPTTFETREGETYYRAELSLDTHQVNKNGTNYPVLPGMVVQAEIITGAKTVLKYLIKPVARAIDKSFSER